MKTCLSSLNWSGKAAVGSKLQMSNQSEMVELGQPLPNLSGNHRCNLTIDIVRCSAVWNTNIELRPKFSKTLGDGAREP